MCLFRNISSHLIVAYAVYVTIGPKLIHGSLATPRYLAKVGSPLFSWPRTCCSLQSALSRQPSLNSSEKCMVLVHFKTTASFEFQPSMRPSWSNDDQKNITTFAMKGSTYTTDTSCFLDHRDSDPLPSPVRVNCQCPRTLSNRHTWRQRSSLCCAVWINSLQLYVMSTRAVLYGSTSTSVQLRSTNSSSSSSSTDGTERNLTFLLGF